MNKTGIIYGVNGPVIYLKGDPGFKISEMVYVGPEKLVGEVIGLKKGMTTVQVFEETTGLKPGDTVIGTGDAISVLLGPGIIHNIFDGIQRPLEEIAKSSGKYISRGVSVDSLDTSKKWDVHVTVKVGDVVSAGTIIAETQETASILHKSMVPPTIGGEVEVIKAVPDGAYTILEPNHLMAPSIMYMKDGRKLWEKFFMDMRTDQLTENDYFMDLEGNRFYPGAGLIPSQAPCYVHNVLPVPGMGSFFDIIPWGSSGILGVKWHYLFYGDKQVIADNYEMGKKYLEHLKTKQNAEGFLNYGLGDWGNPDNQLARENVETAFLYADAITLAEFAEILGEKEDEVQLRQFAEEIKENYNQRLLVQDEKGKWCYRSFEHTEKLVITQACEALPLYWGMVPEDKVSDVAEAFRQTFLEKRAFASGEVGLPYIIQTASRYGMNDLICSFIMKPEHPSYYAFVKEGLTTLGEYWEENPRSHCHDMMGHIIEWYYNGLAGIKPLEPGFKKVLIKPYLPESMNYMKCRYESVSGMIQVILTRKDGRVEVETDIAEGISFEIDCSNLK